MSKSYSNKKSNYSNSKMVPPTGTAENLEAEKALTGESQEEFIRWMENRITPMLKKKGTEDLIEEPGKTARKPPASTEYALNSGSDRARAQEARTFRDDLL